MPAKVRQDQLIARSKRLRCGQPEFMMDRKRMEQHDRRTVTQHVISDLSVATLDMNHRIGDILSGTFPFARECGVVRTRSITTTARHLVAVLKSERAIQKIRAPSIPQLLRDAKKPLPSG
jgi:hypothetical protein